MPNTVLPDGASVIAEVLAASEPRPSQSDKTSVKIRYAVKFADQIAIRIAAHLRDRFPSIQASASRDAGSVSGRKQLDINFSTPHLGLALGISLKSVHVRDVGSAGRYTHNMKRNEEELRIEAYGYHKRQPYAVMIGVLFLPFDSCDDGRRDNPSSFGSWVKHLRIYAGRTDPKNEFDRFEKIYVALYEPDGTNLRFFDVESAPPKQGRSTSLLSYGEFLGAVHHAFLVRNHAEFKWAEGDEEPIDVEDEESQS
jgi:hypothetical protein